MTDEVIGCRDMRHEEWVRRSSVIRRLNSAYFHYRCHRWRWHPRFRPTSGGPAIDRPIFLLGTQGGGLTILSRILRRTPGIVSVTGNHRYWAGYDEMQDVLYDLLPPELRLSRPDILFRRPDRVSWLYASSLLFAEYHQTEHDNTVDLARSFTGALRSVLNMNAAADFPRQLRFIDKSQSYTVRIGLLSAMLRQYSPRFVLITRNPYALCWRAVCKVGPIVELNMSLKAKVVLAAEHWRNSMRTALSEADDGSLRWWRFEDFLKRPRETVRDICSFVDVPYSDAIMPGPDDRIPWGSTWDAFDRSKWYPIRRAVNQSYLRELPAWAAEIIDIRCGDLGRRFGYSREDGTLDEVCI